MRGRGSLKPFMRERGISSTSPFHNPADGDWIVSSPTPIERYGLGLLETDMDQILASTGSNSGARNS
jgi:hypothetical protein